MRKPFIAGNWKMHKTIEEAVTFARRLKELAPRCTDRDVLVAPPFTALSAMSETLRGTGVHIAAQNMHEAPQGAFTGEVSAAMLAEAGCDYVIIGHSERRTLFGEDDTRINRKIVAALENGLKVIFCIGETLEEREAGLTTKVVERQIKEGLKALRNDDIRRLVIAYEPVWAIGTGKTATPAQAEEVHAFIRGLMSRLYNEDTANSLPILYGGSVKPDNMAELMAQPNVDGGLIGGASLEFDSFSQMVMFDRLD
ncbi:MAG: triose-phosphate isomerase [Syntrophales bacterium]|jgi:triosephosphate isomerase|nr:triose-phosphate isomerase [Syntrophales bacterium]